ncbi:MAG: DUF5668 domain-containing protein [Bacillota bacterium]
MALRSIFSGVALILIGLLLLGNTLGYVSWAVWLQVLQFWPLLLVGIGLDLIFRRWRMPAFPAAIIAMVILGCTIKPGLPPYYRYNYIYQYTPWRYMRSPVPQLRQTIIERPLEVTKANLSFEFGGINLDLREGSDQLFSGSFDYCYDAPSVAYERRGDIADVRIRQESITGNLPNMEWDVRLSDSVEFNIELRGGAARAVLDFSSIRISSVDIALGASDLRMIFGDNGTHSDVNVSTGASSITVVVPQSVGIRINVNEHFTTRHNLDDAGLIKRGGVWESPDYESAATRVDMVVSSAVSSFRLEKPRVH